MRFMVSPLRAPSPAFAVGPLAVSVMSSPFPGSAWTPCRPMPGPSRWLCGRQSGCERTGGVMRRAQHRNLFLEVGKRLKSPVHRGEPQVRDLVKLAKRAQNGQADFVGGHFRAAACPDFVLDLLG